MREEIKARTSYENGMSLGEVRHVLETAIKNSNEHVACALAFQNPDSYRGYYECIAFEPSRNLTLGEMLESVNGAIGTTYEGYKGGEFMMDERTEVFIAFPGYPGWPLTEDLMQAVWNSQGMWV